MSLQLARRSPHRRLPTVRSSRPVIDLLESRTLLSTTVSHPTFVLGPFGGTGPAGGFTPAQLQTGYGFSSISFNGTAGTGSGETIAIVDAYNDPDIQSNLNTFDSEFSLPSLTVTVVNQTGGSKLPGADSTGGWELEESLDVEWAHAMAPGAKIMLVEASSSSIANLLTAVSYAKENASVVSMSWGGSEWSGETSDDGDFDQSGVAFVASAGDEGARRGVAGGLAERSRCRRDRPHFDFEQCLLQRDGLERQWRWAERLRVATVIPDRGRHPNVDGAGHSRRCL